MLPPRGSCREAAEGEAPNHALHHAWQVVPSPCSANACPPKVRVTAPYQFALVDNGPPVIFDVPAGPNLEIVGIVSISQPGTADIAALFDRLAESIWMDTSP